MCGPTLACQCQMSTAAYGRQPPFAGDARDGGTRVLHRFTLSWPVRQCEEENTAVAHLPAVAAQCDVVTGGYQLFDEFSDEFVAYLGGAHPWASSAVSHHLCADGARSVIYSTTRRLPPETTPPAVKVRDRR